MHKIGSFHSLFYTLNSWRAWLSRVTRIGFCRKVERDSRQGCRRWVGRVGNCPPSVCQMNQLTVSQSEGVDCAPHTLQPAHPALGTLLHPCQSFAEFSLSAKDQTIPLIRLKENELRSNFMSSFVFSQNHTGSTIAISKFLCKENGAQYWNHFWY